MNTNSQQDINDINYHALAMRSALLDGNLDAIPDLHKWFMGKAARALLTQDRPSLQVLSEHLSSIASLAKEILPDLQGQFIGVSEILYMCSNVYSPLGQIRLADPKHVSGKVLRLVGQREMIKPGEIAKELSLSASRVSNVLRQLDDEGLIHRQPKGNSSLVYLTQLGKDTLELFADPAKDCRK